MMVFRMLQWNQNFKYIHQSIVSFIQSVSQPVLYILASLLFLHSIRANKKIPYKFIVNDVDSNNNNNNKWCQQKYANKCLALEQIIFCIGRVCFASGVNRNKCKKSSVHTFFFTRVRNAPAIQHTHTHTRLYAFAYTPINSLKLLS